MTYSNEVGHRTSQSLLTYLKRYGPEKLWMKVHILTAVTLKSWSRSLFSKLSPGLLTMDTKFHNPSIHDCNDIVCKPNLLFDICDLEVGQGHRGRIGISKLCYGQKCHP